MREKNFNSNILKKTLYWNN